MTEQNFVFVGETRISNVWFRRLCRPTSSNDRSHVQLANVAHQFYKGHRLKIAPGFVEDPALLDIITRDIQEGMVGARNFQAEYALVVTWERVGFGGTARYFQLEEYQTIKRWAGFNGGNGTGFVELPYSSEGNSYKLSLYGGANVNGRWLSRVDEEILYGGCLNSSTGQLMLETDAISMLGGHMINVSGPCLKTEDIIKLQLEEVIVDCKRISTIKASCILPTDTLFRADYCPIGLSTNNGLDYRWWSIILIASPDKTPLMLKLLNDPVNMENHWRSADATNLTLRWSPTNITSKMYNRLSISLWGYWEDVTEIQFTKISVLAEDLPNTGLYNFNPKTLTKSCLVDDCWKRFYGGVLQISVPNWNNEVGDGVYWSEKVPFNWYFNQIWEDYYGDEWALKRCLKWFDYDGQRNNFMMEVETWRPCPCLLSQAVADFGRFITIASCDNDGDTSCFYGEGAANCVVSTSATVSGAAQVCCYDDFGYLMFSQDYEYNVHYMRFFGAGVPYRAHPWGVFPYRRPPYIPAFSNFINDLLPYEACCLWAGRCEFYYWRRMTSGCQGYQPPALAYVYGLGHFVTFDGTQYTFCGQGHYVLAQMNAEYIDLMVQIRMEQSTNNLGGWQDAKCTMVTGLAAQDNSSAVVQVFARKEHRRWRYKTDVYVDGVRIFFDQLHKKRLQFSGVALRTAALNMDMSEIQIMFKTGVGIQVTEVDGALRISVALPPEYKGNAEQTLKRLDDVSDCQLYNSTFGLFGTYNGDAEDDFVNSRCHLLSNGQTSYHSENLFHNFGQSWIAYSLLFDIKFYPLYDPPKFWNTSFVPTFDLSIKNESFWHSVTVSMMELMAICRQSEICIADFVVTRSKEFALATLTSGKNFQELKENGETYYGSCGPLEKGEGVLKFPPGKNYLDGSVVTFMCKPEYYLHGDYRRECQNGLWSGGWPVWCRRREHELALKWITGLIVTFGLIVTISVLFCWFTKKRKISVRIYAVK